jgi:hypothetical protein
MTDPVERLIERIRKIIDDHREHEPARAAGIANGWEANGLSDHSRHIAEQIVDMLGLKHDSLGDFRNELRYVSAWFDQELTKLEGTE